MMHPLSFQEIALKEPDDLLGFLGVTKSGLGEEEAVRRLQVNGANELPSKENLWWEILLRQFKSAFIYLLIAASIVAFIQKEYLDGGIILLFLLINALLGFYQEYRAEHALRLLKSFVDRKTRVFRGGKELLISVRDVVPGDIVRLDAGDTIPGDGYFLRADQVTVDESPMTGESVPVEKHAGALSTAPKDFFAAQNIGFSRTTLLSGDADVVIFATGEETQVGLITGKMREAESPSAFEEGISRFSRFILKLVLMTIPLVFLLHALVQHDGISVGDFLLFSIALTVSAIPEVLPLVTTISLSRGALILAKKHVVPRRLSAIEDLGSINILCTDKTGTITENKLTVGEIFGERDELLSFALMAPLSAGDISSVQNSVFDTALIGAADEKLKASLKGLRRIDELPFDPIRRRGSVLVEHHGKQYLVMRGAPEIVCKKTAHEEFAWEKKEGAKGRRTLAVAYKEVHYKKERSITEADEKGLHCVGLVSFTDPLKPSTRTAVRHAEALGVKVKVITGDGPEVAGWIGVEAGILKHHEEVLLGEQFEAMDAEAQGQAVETYHVFARTTPVQKFNIIKKLEEKHLVGFLGEGFNDAPALKMAHVGLAVSGASDIAQDASDIVLLNQSLEVIVDGIKEGRKIFANTMKYIRATLTSNFGNFYALAFSSLFVPYLPMLPVQVLLLNLLSDFPMISIAADNVDDSELKRPRGYQVGELTTIAIVLGVVSTLFDFAFFGYFQQFGEKTLQTMWFMGSILTELILLFSIRTMLPFWKAKAPSVTVVWLTFSVMALTVLLPFIAPMREIFGFIRPEPSHLFMALFLVLFYFASTEIAKLIFCRYWGEGSEHHGIVKKRHLNI